MKRIIIFLLVLAAFYNSNAQNPEWVNFTSDEVMAVVDDANYIWAGGSGLTRIDKKTGEMTHFNRTNSILPTNTIKTLALDKSGILWIGTRYGLVSYDNSSWTAYSTGDSTFPLTLINYITVDSLNNIWIATDNNGIIFYDRKNWLNYSNKNSDLPINRINCIAIDKNNVKWFGTSSGVVKFDGNNFTHYYKLNSGLPVDFVNSIAIDTNNNKWIATFGGGLTKFDDTNWTSYSSINSGLSFDGVNIAEIDNHNNIWIGTMKGIDIFDGQSWQHIDFQGTNFYDYNFKVLHFSNDGNIFFCNSRNMIKFDGNVFETINTSNSGVPALNFRDILIGKNDEIWFGSGVGLIKYKHGSWTEYNSINSNFYSNNISDINQDRNGNIYFLLGDAEFGIYDNQKFSFYRDTNYNLQAQSFIALHIDRNDEIWLGTRMEGLLKFNDTIVAQYKIRDTITTKNMMNKIKSDSKNNLWITSESNGLLIFDGKNFFAYDNTNSPFLTPNFQALYVDRSDKVWVGRRLTGLIGFDGNNWDSLNIGNSPVSSVYCLTEDNYGVFWIGCANGLVKYDGVNFENFDLSNSGLPDRVVNSIAIDKYDNKWIATPSGLAIYREGGVILSAEDEKQYIQQKTNILCFPNPTSLNLNIQINNIEPGNITLKLFDIFGREVETIFEGYVNGSLNLSHSIEKFSSGTYFLVLTTKTGRTAERIVVSN